MTAPRTRFYLDKQNRKWSGVCAGIADYTGIDVTLDPHRAAWSSPCWAASPGRSSLIGSSPGWRRQSRFHSYETDPVEQKFWQGVRANPRRTARDVRSRFRDIDRRLADVETYVTSSNSRLAREIEQLR